MDSTSQTSGASRSGAGSNNKNWRCQCEKAMKMTYTKSRKRRNQRSKQHSNKGVSHKGKEQAHSPPVPSTNSESDGVNVPQQVLVAAVQDVHDHFDNEIAQLRNNYRHRQHIQAENTYDNPGASGSGSSHATPATITSNIIEIPQNRTGTKVVDIRRKCGMEGLEHENDWNDINTSIRDQMLRFGFEWEHSWKQQDPSQLGLLYAAINERCPILKQFRNSWATKFIVQEKFNNRKGYKARNRQKRGLEPTAGSYSQCSKKHRAMVDTCMARS
ncbi:hypothetical protein BN14_12234 [Rhizoctonia solani AG-1 IB]|uniref:Uncharacterized protein n=1 Tax=Thanatephorus cucumeris (strain AG1-IB / isolate 7/3/14) TaxID=1108050 RepID=M5CFI6_THACB|nr:hypothetical protein BN14_12234 [Rhizoctonia solani AG-1 IB]